MEGLRENRPLLMVLSASQLVLLCAAAAISPELNESLELVTEWPNAEFSNTLAFILILDFTATHLVERLCAWIFPLAVPKST